MAPCMRLYAFLGQKLDQGLPGGLESNKYAEWVQTYSTPDFEKLAVILEELLNDYSKQVGTFCFGRYNY